MNEAPRYEPLSEGPLHEAHRKFTGIDRFDWDALGPYEFKQANK